MFQKHIRKTHIPIEKKKPDTFIVKSIFKTFRKIVLLIIFTIDLEIYHFFNVCISYVSVS